MEIVVAAKQEKSTVKKKTSEEMEKIRKEANRLVKGVFRCHEPRGGSATFVWKEHKGDPVRRYTLKDSEEYELPVGLAQHLNKNVCYHEHGHIIDAGGNPLIDRRNKKVSRMNFESLEFYA